ncbi:MAG TPA: acyltransferase [Ktedonobacteraceae bacterium]|nr:acyltransferase [Ktedonobacteraceae bacterium]
MQRTIVVRTIWVVYCFLESLFLRLYRWIGYLLGDTKDAHRQSSIAVLDGVRAIACLIVVAYHISLISRDTNVWVPNDPSHLILSSIALAGGSGVTLFFVLSGFLLFMPYAKSLLFDSTWPAARLFYMRRVLRIIPAYYASLFLMILLFHQEYLQRAHWHDLFLFLTFFMDSSSATFEKLNGPFWTLAVEWQFYLLLPLMMLVVGLIVRHGTLKWRMWKLTLCLLGIICWGLCSRYLGMYYTANTTQTFIVPRPVMNDALFFLYGQSGKYLEDFAVGMFICMCYIYSQRVGPDHPFSVGMRRVSFWLWRAGIVLLFFMAMWHLDWFYVNHWTFLDAISRTYGWFNYFNWLGEICLALGFGLCVIAILYGSAHLQHPFTWRPLRWIGLISFSMYMWHLPLLIIAMNLVTYHFAAWGGYRIYGFYWLWVLLVVIPVSFLMYIWVEKPWMKFGDKFRSQPAKPEPIKSAPAPEDVSTPAEPVFAGR